MSQPRRETAHRAPGPRSVRALLRSITGAAVCVAASMAGAGAAAAYLSPASLHVGISVPSVLASNGTLVWVANTGNSAVIELSARSGRELRLVSGAQFSLDNSDAIVQYGSDVWVANASSDSVTEFNALSGSLEHLFSAPSFHFGTPVAMAIADRRVFVLAQAGNRVTVLNERTGHLVRYLRGRRFHFDHAVGMVRVGGDIWVLSSGAGGTLTELRAATGRVVRVVSATAQLDSPTAIASDGVHLWVANARGSHLVMLSASDGRLVRSVTSASVPLNRVTTIAVAHGCVWVASTIGRTYVAGFRASDGKLIHVYARHFGYPAVFGDTHHAWVVDRIQSRITELAPGSGKVVRVISR